MQCLYSSLAELRLEIISPALGSLAWKMGLAIKAPTSRGGGVD